MKTNYKIYLKDILEASNLIEEFVRRMNFEDFLEDKKTSSAVIRQLEIIGEAAKNIPIEVKKQHQIIPWKQIAGMRDRLIHQYMKVDYQVVWDSIQMLPQIKQLVKEILSKPNNGGT